jgi:hypothetical protein
VSAPPTPEAFEETTAYERWVLEELVPLPATGGPYGFIVDLGQPELRPVKTPVSLTVGGTLGRVVRVDVRPLLFGAAWKVADLLVEHAIVRADPTAAAGQGWLRIDEKVTRARNGRVLPVPPFDRDGFDPGTAMWRALLACYAETVEIRHALVHRQVVVEEGSGGLVAPGRQGGHHRLGPEQLDAFCRAVQWAARAVTGDGLGARERADLAWNLDQLTDIHRAGHLGGLRLGDIALLIAPEPTEIDDAGCVVVRKDDLLAEGRRSFPKVDIFDASFRLPDGRRLMVELEQVPEGTTTVDPDHLPPWARFSADEI